MNPDNLKIILGIASVALMAFFPQIWEKIKPYFPKKGLLPPEKSKGVSTTGLDGYNLHDIVEFLAMDCKKKKDNDGLMLIGTFGKHMYDEMMKGAK